MKRTATSPTREEKNLHAEANKSRDRILKAISTARINDSEEILGKKIAREQNDDGEQILLFEDLTWIGFKFIECYLDEYEISLSEHSPFFLGEYIVPEEYRRYLELMAQLAELKQEKFKPTAETQEANLRRQRRRMYEDLKKEFEPK